MRQFATQGAFFEPQCDAGFNFLGARASRPLSDECWIRAGETPALPVELMMLALERALAPPVVHRRSFLQPMRIVVVDPALFANQAHQVLPDEMPHVLPRALPPQSGTNPAMNQFHQRTVRGEILSDEHGRLYEKIGRQIHPINQLASGPSGEVIDLVPVNKPDQRLITHAVEAPPATERVQSEQDTSNAENGTAAKIEAVKTSVQPPANGIGYRKLFADPGQWRVVWWGDFKEILTGQLAHPERLRDTYRLPCYVQVIETERTVAIEELAAIYKSDSKKQTPLYILTDELAAKLDLVLPLRAAPSRDARRPPNTLLAHERVFRIVAANDPTIDVVTNKPKLSSVPAANVDNGKAGTTTLPNTLKDSIPARFIKEWEFKLTREEASYDMTAKPTLGTFISSVARRLRFLRTHHEFRKWQTLLTGKSFDEQLWAVRPPTGMLADSFIRNWAERTLELAGYDQRKMMSEWEIFWRRKGY